MCHPTNGWQKKRPFCQDRIEDIPFLGFQNEYILCSVGAEKTLFTPTNHNMTNQLLLTYKIHSPTPEYITPLLE
jgi:hypothetical protein